MSDGEEGCAEAVAKQQRDVAHAADAIALALAKDIAERLQRRLRIAPRDERGNRRIDRLCDDFTDVITVQ